MNLYQFVPIVLVVILSLSPDLAEGWRRRRRRQCSSVNCAVSSWKNTYSACSHRCGSAGTQSRSRTITRAATCGGSCPYSLTDIRPCNRGCQHGGTPLPGRCVCQRNYRGTCCEIGDGGWSAWGAWAACSKTCGTSGIQFRTRACNNPTPRNGGRRCSGSAYQKKGCFRPHCPVHGQWSGWTMPSPCSRTCGGTGRQTSYRSCTNPSPAYGGAQCRGSSNKTTPCSTPRCPVDGGWGSWETWGPCSKTCGNGTSTRHRSCDSPSPAHGGKACRPPSTQQQSCGDSICLRSINCYVAITTWTVIKDYRSEMNWKDMTKVVSKCAKFAHKQGYRFFAMHYYTKCLVDTTKVYDYAKNGQSTQCWSGVGMDNSMHVYLIL